MKEIIRKEEITEGIGRNRNGEEFIDVWDIIEEIIIGLIYGFVMGKEKRIYRLYWYLIVGFWIMKVSI